MTFRNSDGTYTPGVNLSIQDIRNQLLRLPGDHWLEPRDNPIFGSRTNGFWRIAARKIPEISHLFSANARPSVRAILFSSRFGYKPERLQRTCGQPGCLNPLHQKEINVTPAELYHIYFQKAYETAEQGGALTLSFPTEGEAFSHRAKLNSFRRRALDQRLCPEAWEHLSLKIEQIDGHAGWQLSAHLPAASFEETLRSALGDAFPESAIPSALDLISGDFDE